MLTSLTISPQEAVLSSGTLRQGKLQSILLALRHLDADMPLALDINEEHTDAELHAVLKWYGSATVHSDNMAHHPTCLVSVYILQGVRTRIPDRRGSLIWTKR
jgi:hypothetical protein